ncbi:MAG: glycogen/starch synthase [Fibrobacteres bacterium]|jgi:starch synthase|nr:glycogen/starch synthase [Fibrobacterota bacterium]
MRILLLSPEHPAQNTKGSGSPVGRDVEALAQAYLEHGHEVRVCAPLYQAPAEDAPWSRVATVRASFLKVEEADILAGDPRWPYLRLVSHPILVRNHPYLDEQGYDHPDNALRFALFSAASLMDCAAEGWIPDLIHAHEWQTGLSMLYASVHFKSMFPDTRLLFSFQDAAFQGLCDAKWAPEIGLGPEWMRPDKLEFWGRLNLLKAGLLCCHRATLPSLQYMQELLGDSHGYGLEGLFRSLGAKVAAVNPGVDGSVWKIPEEVKGEPDGLVAWKNKKRQELTGGSEPLIVFASSFRPGKGIDHVLTLMPDLLKMDLRVGVVGGHGTDEHKHLELVARSHPDRIRLYPKDDQVLFDVLAAADLLLLPVAHQPGGVLFARAMALGTPTLAHRVGAAADKIVSWPKSIADGFLFDDLAPDTLLRHLRKALQIRNNATDWTGLCSRAAGRDFTWKKIAALYLALCPGA